MTPRFTLHGLHLSGPSYKVALMLALSGEAYAFHPVMLSEGEHRQAAHMARNRYGQVPVLEDHRSGMTLVQSGAILHYLAAELGRFGGDGKVEQAQALEWLFWDFDKLASPVYRSRAMRLGLRPLPQAVAEMYHSDGQGALQQLETALAGHDWLVGQGPTIADISAYGVVAYAAEAGFAMASYPSVAAWMQRFEALPHFARAAQLMQPPSA